MPRRKIQVLTKSFAPRAVYDTAVSRALLGRVASGEAPESLRLYSPGRVLAFSLFDRRQTGFGDAVEQAHLRSFRPVLRLTGGRAAAFHSAALGFGWCIPTHDVRAGIRERFVEISSIVQATLTKLGVDARIGKVADEYCPGDYSVNARGIRKLMGVGQRVLRGAAYVGGMLMVGDADCACQALEPVYRALDFPFDPDSVGSISEEIGEISLEEVAAALLRELSRHYEVTSGAFDDDTLRLAHDFEPRHRVDAPRTAPSVEIAPEPTPLEKIVEGSSDHKDLRSSNSGHR